MLTQKSVNLRFEQLNTNRSVMKLVLSLLLLILSTATAEDITLKTDFKEEKTPAWLVARYPFLEISNNALHLKFHKGHASSWGIPVTADDLSVAMNFKWEKSKFFSLRFEHGFNLHLCRILVYPNEVILRVDQPQGVKTKDFVVLDKKDLSLEPGKMHSLTLTVKGDELTAKINDVILNGKHPILKKIKSSIILAMKGGSMEISSLEVNAQNATISKKIPFSFNRKASFTVSKKAKEVTEAKPKVKTAKDEERALGLFNDYVLPSLKKHCYKCHSHEYEKAKGGLVLDSKSGIFGGGDLGPSVVPGNLEKSWLYQAVLWDDEDLEMPPKYKLEDDEIAHIKEWIELGAPDPRKGTIIDGQEHKKSKVPKAEDIWSFQQIKKPTVPNIKAKSDIDKLIVSALNSKGLSQAEKANPEVLIERIHFVLTGILPNLKQRQKFLKHYSQDSEKALSSTIDSLMSSKEFGERWGRHWMDVARYADVTGETAPKPYKNSWRYRNWIIDAFNSDMPFEQFVKEQIAGDLVGSNGLGTGYLAIGHVPSADRDKERQKMDSIDEQLDVIGKTFLGLTIGCARCHDHKLDPISHKDYYAMAGIFRSTDVLKGKSLVKEAEKVRDEPIHLRGDVYLLGEVVPRGFLSALNVKNTKQISNKQSGRLELAEWLLSKENPLTYRVIVNRVWHHLFGQGIVRTTDNFGSTGDIPGNQKLLDYLAQSFREQHRGSFKSFIKSVMLTDTWQLSSETSKKAEEIDPNNRLNWKMNLRRLDAETLVDSIHFLSNSLNKNKAQFTVPKFKTGNFVSTSNLDIPEKTLKYRSVYWPVFRKDQPVKMDVLSIFGFPDASSPKGVRDTVTVPAQSLYLMNSKRVLDASKEISKQVLVQGSETKQHINQSFLLLLGRKATVQEMENSLIFLKEFSAELKSSRRSLEKADREAFEKLVHALLASNEFLTID